MNIKRLFLAILAGFVFITGSDMLVHGVWLKPVYKATMHLWRSEVEMNRLLGWMFAAQFLCALTFVLLWAAGFAERGTMGRACIFGVIMGLFGQVNTLVMYVVMPLPAEIPVKWFVSGMAQAVVLAVVTFFVYKPRRK